MEFENDNQIVDEQVEVTEIQPEETEVIETSPPEEDYIPVKYNKEELKIRRDEAPTYIQKGLNYDKVKQRAEELEKTSSYLDRVAKFSGYQSVDDFIQAVEEAEKAQQIQQEAQKYGLNEDVYKQFFEPVKNELTQTKEQLAEMQKERQLLQIDREVNELRGKYEDFGNYEERVFETAIQKGYALEDAYKLVTYEDRIQNAARQTEQQVLAQVTGRDGKQVLRSNDQPGNTVFDPSNMSFEEIEQLSQRARRGERITF